MKFSATLLAVILSMTSPTVNTQQSVNQAVWNVFKEKRDEPISVDSQESGNQAVWNVFKDKRDEPITVDSQESGSQAVWNVFKA
ncbi:hypothetical protein DL95DRAFT_452212 [Leptodontidium sp. 2 PMI_412]|nr:hypothetical protein DL95DRAFT_452212 [Leptodontidium sp. 2 PMI_412]